MPAWACLLWGTLLASLFVSCSRRVHTASPPAAVTAADNSYTDLLPGQHLRIVVPLLRAGGYRVRTGTVRPGGNTIVLSANDLIGYESYRYIVEQRARHRVAIGFERAEISRDGKSAPDAAPPALPFALPERAQHVRLIYLVRSSQSDHNMAIAAARRLETLDAFTSRLKADPQICHNDDRVFCSWVPLGIALRPE